MVGRAQRMKHDPLLDPVRFVDRRSGAAPLLRKALRYAFPDHWSFLLGEVALYAFIVLVATGTFLALFFEPSLAQTVYDGSYEPLRGATMSVAYKSAVDLSFEVKAGLLMRQTHHWAADVFVAAIVVHLIRVFFTGAYRRPRELTYAIGVVMLMLSLLEGYLGYSMVDDLLSGMGLAIGYAVALSTPLIGGNLGLLIWGDPYPGDPSFESRMFIAHVFIIPAILAALIGAHLALVAARHHTQFRRSERVLVGVPAFPGQAPRSIALALIVAAVLFALGGLVQINPIWLWGPYETWLGTNGAQPDWYLGWLIGGLRLVPGFDVTVGDATIVPNPFWGGALFPLIVFGGLLAWPWAERRLTRDRASHNVLDRPRDAPLRTAIGSGFLTWVVLVFFAGSADRLFVFLGLSYEAQIWFWRFAVWIIPVLVGLGAHRVCNALRRFEEVEAIRERELERVRVARELHDEIAEPDRRLRVSPQVRKHVLALDARRSIEDMNELKRTVPILVVSILLFFAHQALHLEPATVALTDPTAMLLVTRQPLERVLGGIEWPTLFFFLGLFVMVGALEHTGAIDEVAEGIASVTARDRTAELLGIA
jgi:ubiquinol-cytochrome c reductase cytochrome b subunit